MSSRRAALVVAGAGAVAGVRRWRSVAVVPPELRTLGLWLPFVVDNPLTLGVGRKRFAAVSDVVPEVELTSARVRSTDGHDVRAFVYRPRDAEGPLGAVLWMHGGGYILGDPRRDHEWCSLLAREAGVVVVSVDYRLAPEQPYPRGLHDCVTVLQWLHREAGRLGVDRTRLAVGGASAGGGLAAAVAQYAHDHTDVPLAFQLLVYPMLDDRTVVKRGHRGRGRLQWTPRANRFAWRSYLGRPPGTEVPSYAAPARRADLTGLPPAWIGVGDIDLFYEEDVEYADRLVAAGVPCVLHVEPRMPHGADAQHAETVPTMAAFRQRMIDEVRDSIGLARV